MAVRIINLQLTAALERCYVLSTMPVINLADIQQITKTQQQVLFPSQKYHPNRSAFDSIVADNFSLVMRQLFLGLTVEPLLNAYPQIAQWVYQIQELAPEIFKSRKKLLVDNPVIAPLAINDDKHFIQVLTNIAFKQGIPRLYEWAIRHPYLSWQDRVKLWTTARQYSVTPNQIQLVVLALHPDKAAQRLDVRWNKKDQMQTEKWLIKLLTQSPDNKSQSNIVIPELSSMVNLEAIPEVKI
ncbi:MAG: hypothetical protein RM022_028605 [Nostoc sp. EfeVER01]|uniref:hypothetical protein n=1 Tax=Nostoc sp. EfeVER01 TaxID=3075406 RepID=UPI00391C5609